MKIKVKLKENKQLVQEITEEEYSFVEEALEIPIEEMPYSNIFGDKYRIIREFGTLSDGNPFGKMIKKLSEFGWNLAEHEGDKAIELYKEYTLVKPNPKYAEDPTGGQYIRNPQYVKMTLQKLIQKMNAFATKGVVSMFAKRQNVTKRNYEDQNALRDELQARSPDGTIKGELTDEYKEGLAALDKKYGLPARALVAKMRTGINLYFGRTSGMTYEVLAMKNRSRVEDLLEDLEEYSKLISDEREMYQIQSNFDRLFEPTYVIYSRHPVDVFRMSDFVQVTSCHSPPSRKGDKQGFDEYNICALAEAYANGMIAYAVPAKSFEDVDLEPTQESLDEIGEDELFWDQERSEGQVEPVARVRIRNVAFTDRETGQVTRVAVPDKKTYGKPPANFSTYVRNFVAAAQREQINQIANSDAVDRFDDGDINIPLENFERFGGSYEDGGAAVRDNMPLMFASALNISAAKITMPGNLNYDHTLQRELKDKFQTGLSQEDLDQMVNRQANSYGGPGRYKIDASAYMSDDYHPIMDSIDVTAYAVLPMTDDELRENYTDIAELFEGHSDSFAVWFNEDQIPPDNVIPMYSGQGRGDKPVLELNFQNLQFNMSEAGMDLYIEDGHSVSEILQTVGDSSRNGGFGFDLYTDPYVEDGFDAIAKGILDISQYGTGEEFYLTRILNKHLEPDSSVGDWQPVNVEIEYHDYTNVEYYKEAEFETFIEIDTEWMLEAGLTPEQVGIFILAINQHDIVKSELVRLIYMHLIMDRSALSTYDFRSGLTVGNEDTYTTLQDVVEDAGNIAASFELKLKVDAEDDVYSKKTAAALEIWLTEYDSNSSADDALSSGRGQIFIKNVLEQFPKQQTNESKKRMKVRMIRG